MSQPQAYCTADTVMFLSQIKAQQLEFKSDSDYETFIQQKLVPAAQKIIDGYVNHNFFSNSGTITLDGRGKRILLIPPPYLPVTSIINVTADGVNVTPSIKAFPTYISYNGGYFYENPSNAQNVSVALNYGYSEVPEDVSYVCAQMVVGMLAEMVRKKMMPDAIAKSVSADSEVTEVSPLMRSSRVFNAEMKEILSQYQYTYFDFT